MNTVDVTRAQLHEDLLEYARLAETDYRQNLVDAVLDALGPGWTEAWIGIRTTTQPLPQREVSVRFTGLPARLDPVRRLREAGLLRFTGHPMENLIAEITESVPVRWGVDVATATGVQKIWLEFTDLLTTENLHTWKNLPPSVRNHRAHLARWTGGKLALLAVDFPNHTLNLYGQLRGPGGLTSTDLAAILAELDFAGPTDAELTALESPFTVYYTFSWDTPGPTRCCFPARFTRETFPALDPMLSRFVTGPTAGPGPHGCAAYIAYGPTGRYYKAQLDYLSPFFAKLPGGTAVPEPH